MPPPVRSLFPSNPNKKRNATIHFANGMTLWMAGAHNKSNLTEKLTHPSGLTLTQSYEEHRDLLTQVTDDAGTRSFTYNAFGEKEIDELLADGITH